MIEGPYKPLMEILKTEIQFIFMATTTQNAKSEELAKYIVKINTII